MFPFISITFAAGPDVDVDGIPDATDNCLVTANADQADGDGDALGDACDNCPDIWNAPSEPNGAQSDADGDGFGDLCDRCVYLASDANDDADGDGLGDACDNCPDHANDDQNDVDRDGLGATCDPDDGGTAGGSPCTTGPGSANLGWVGFGLLVALRRVGRRR